MNFLSASYISSWLSQVRCSEADCYGRYLLAVQCRSDSCWAGLSYIKVCLTEALLLGSNDQAASRRVFKWPISTTRLAKGRATLSKGFNGLFN